MSWYDDNIGVYEPPEEWYLYDEQEKMITLKKEIQSTIEKIKNIKNPDEKLNLSIKLMLNGERLRKLKELNRITTLETDTNKESYGVNMYRCYRCFYVENCSRCSFCEACSFCFGLCSARNCLFCSGLPISPYKEYYFKNKQLDFREYDALFLEFTKIRYNIDALEKWIFNK